MNEPWTPETYPAIPPDAKFRHDLQRALEQTHRQQIAQRKVGAYSPPRRRLSSRRVAGGLLLLLALLLVARLYLNQDASD